MVKKVAVNHGKRHLITMDRELAMRIGYIGTVQIMPIFLTAVIRYMLTGRIIQPRVFYYAGHANAALRKKFNLPEPERNAYE